jgi:hypothetical protein
VFIIEAHKMSDSKTPTRYTGMDRRAPRAEPGAGNTVPDVPREGRKTGGRHAAITTNLYNWHSYKNWADKVRGSWDDKK